MKRGFGLLLLLFTSTMFSSSECDQPYNYEFKPGYEVDQDHMIAAYNAPARYNVRCPWDCYIKGYFIYWQPKEQGLDFALSTPLDLTNNKASIINSHFNYDPGFKVELGAYFGEDNWGICANYMHLYTKNTARKYVNTADTTLTNFWRIGPALTDINFIKSKWRLYFDVLDVNIGRPYYNGTHLILHPFAGIRTGWIKQNMFVRSSLDDGNRYITKFETKSWLLGPRFGLNTKWIFGEGFRFFGNIAAALFYDLFKTMALEYPDTDPIVYSTNAYDKSKYFNPNLDFALGFGWGKYNSSHTIHFDLSAGYELLLFFNQNKMRSFLEELKNQVNSTPGNLSPHGFTIAIRLDF